jgi:hypothetical protein
LSKIILGYLLKTVCIEVFESEDIEDSNSALVLVGAVLVVLLPVDGDVDLLDDVDEQAAVDALRESVANVATLVRVQSRNLTKTIRINNDNEC